jgi:hypothetical protein
MKRSARVPVFLLALFLGSLLVGPYVGPTSATHLGASLFDSSLVQPIGVAATPGRVFVTSPYCLDAKDSDKSNDRKVFVFDDKTPSPRPFNTTPLATQGAGCFEDYVAVAGPKDPKAGGLPSPTLAKNSRGESTYFTNYVYVTLGQKVVEITDTGAVLNSSFVNIPACGSDRTGITFDHVGTFGYNMIVTCVNGKVYKVTRNHTPPGTSGTGTATLIANVAAALGLPSVLIENPEVAQRGFGAFGGRIIVAAPSLDRLLAISSSGTVTRLSRWRAAEGVNFIPTTKCGFLNSTATYLTSVFIPLSGPPGIYQFPVSAFANLAGKAIVTSGANAGLGLLASTSKGTNITPFDNIGSKHEGSTFVDCGVPRFLEIRTDPGGNIPRSIDPKSKGTLLFAILSSSTFDAAGVIIDSSSTTPSPTYGFTGNEDSVIFESCDLRDINADQRPDLVCKSRVTDLNIPASALDPSGVYSGQLTGKWRYKVPGIGGDPDGEGRD